MQQSLIKFLVSVTLGLLSGLLIGRTDIFTIFFLAVVAGLAILIFAITKIIASLSTNSSSNTANYIGLAALVFTVCLVTSFITMTNIISKKQKFAEYLIPKIEQYRQQNSKYPQTLNDLVIDDAKIVTYWTDSTRKTFSIRFIRDGWHFSEYDSRTRQWTSGD